MWKADCYAVIVSRSGGFTGIPYSISGIYEFVTEKKGENTTTSMYQLYEEEHSNGNFGLVITEDSNSGFEMVQYAFDSSGTEVVSAGGNASVLGTLKRTGDRRG